MKRGILILLLLGGTGSAIAAQDVTPKQAAKEKESYINKADKDVQDWTSKIQALEDRSKTAGANARAELDRHLKAVHEGLSAAHKKIDEIRASSANAWQSLQAGLERTLADVKRHYQKAVAAAPPAVKK